MTARLSLAFALALAAGTARAPAAQSRASLEQALAAARAERAALFSAAQPRVDEQMARLARLKPKDKSEIEAVRAALREIGAELAPLWLPYFGAAPAPGENAALRTQLIGELLAELRPPAVLPALLDWAQNGPEGPRAAALLVLGSFDERARVEPVLRASFASTQGGLRAAALGGLARLPGGLPLEISEQALRDPDPRLARVALTAAAQAKDERIAAAVLEYAGSGAASGGALELLAYYRALPARADLAACKALLALAARSELAREQRLALLGALPDFKPDWSAELRKPLEPVLRGGDDELRQEALIALARLGDKSARRDIKREFDELVQKNDGWAQSYAARARIELRLGDFDEAVRDYKKTLQLLENGARDWELERQAWIGLARTYALSKRLKDAASTLEKSGVSAQELRKLAEDPDFAELAAHPKYGKVLGL